MITKLRVENFKSLRELSLEMGTNSAIVGPNMSGKSNVIDVFRFLTDAIVSGGAGSGLAQAFVNRNGFSEVVWKGAEDSRIAIGIEGSLEGAEWDYKLAIRGDLRYGAIQVESEQLAIKKSQREYPLIKSHAAHREIVRADGTSISQVPDTSRLCLEYEIPAWEGNEIRRQIASWRFYKLVPALMRQPNPASAVSFLKEYGDNFSQWMMVLQTRYSESFGRLRSVALEVLPELKDLFTWPTQQSTVFASSQEKFLLRPTNLWQMSDGELAFLALLSLVLAPVELGADLYFIEEPENHLHPRLLTVLFELLRQVQGELGPGRTGQVFITTHSPYVVDKLGIDEVIVIRKSEGASICSRPADNKALRQLLESETVGLGDLYFSGALTRA